MRLDDGNTGSRALQRTLHKMHVITVTTGLPMTAKEREAAIARLLAKAALAEKNGLPRTAQSWRETAANLQQHPRHSAARGSGPIGMASRDRRQLERLRQLLDYKDTSVQYSKMTAGQSDPATRCPECGGKLRVTDARQLLKECTRCECKIAAEAKQPPTRQHPAD